MIRFKDDNQDPEILDLRVKKYMSGKDAALGTLFALAELALAALAGLWVLLPMKGGSMACVLALAFLLVLALFVRPRLRKQLRKQLLAREPGEYTVDEEGVHFHGSRKDMLLRWNHFVSWGIRGKLLYLQMACHRVIVCPTGKLPSEDLAQLKALAESHIGQQK